jgi:hypothetical protein
MARDHFLDLQESGGEWWMEGWRCINCGHVFDPVVERNRRLQETGILSSLMAAKRPNEHGTMSQQELPLDIAA